jgi:hypothetical protein
MAQYIGVIMEVSVRVWSVCYLIGRNQGPICRSHSETGGGDVECRKRTVVLANIHTYCSHII